MKLLNSKNFYTRAGLFSLLSLLGAGFNYMLYPVLARIISPRSFGDFTAIIAISNQVMGILLAFNIISIYLVKTRSEEEARQHTQAIQKVLIWLFTAAAFAVLVASPALSAMLKIAHPVSFVILALILLAAIPSIVWTGYLQGHKELVKVGVFNVSSALSKFVFTVVLAALFGPVIALLGILAGSVFGLMVLRYSSGIELPKLTSVFKSSSTEERQFIRGLGSYIVECTIVVGAFSLLQNFDITLAKILFGPEKAGVYVGISILSNALYYVLFLLVWIILPEIDANDREGNRRVLVTAFKIMSAVTLIVLISELLLKNRIASILLGHSYNNQGTTLIFASLYQISLVAAALFAYHLLVLRSRRSLLLAASIVVCALILPQAFSKTPTDMIRLLWFSVLAGVAIYWLISLLLTRKQYAKR